MVKCEDH